MSAEPAITSANQNLILSGAGNMVLNGALALGTGFISKDGLVGGGTGTLILAGSNTYTGATTAGAGTIRLDYSVNDNSKLSDTAALNLGIVTPLIPGVGSLNTGGRVELAGGTHTETVSGAVLTANTFTSTIARTSGSAVLQLNTITPNTGTGLIFNGPGIATTDNAILNGILGFWARMNTGGVSSWATSAGTADSPVVAFSGYTDVNRLGGFLPSVETNHLRIVNGGTSGNSIFSGVTQAYTVQMSATDGPAIIESVSGTDELNVGNNAGGAIWLASEAAGLTIGSSVGNGVLTSGAEPSAAPALLRLINDSAASNLVVNSVIANNDLDVVGVTKSGAGTVILNANNTFTGPLTVAGGGTLILSGNNAARPTGVSNSTVVSGTLQLQANAGNTSGGISTVLSNEQSANSPFILNNGGTLQLRSDETVTFAGGNSFGGLGSAAVTIDVNQLTAGGSKQTLTFAPIGFNVNTTTINVTGGNGYMLRVGTINNVANNGVMTLNPTSAPLSIAGYTANTTFNTTLQLSGSIAGNTVSGVIANPVTSGVTSLTKIGSSQWELQGANTYTGTTVVREGALTFAGNRTANSGGITVGDTAGLNATLNITAGNFNMGTAVFIVSNQANSATVNQSGGSVSLRAKRWRAGWKCRETWPRARRPRRKYRLPRCRVYRRCFRESPRPDERAGISLPCARRPPRGCELGPRKDRAWLCVRAWRYFWVQTGL